MAPPPVRVDEQPARRDPSEPGARPRFDARQLLDTPPEAEFDAIARLAARACDAPIATVTIIDEHRVWSKALVGTHVRETPRHIAICPLAASRPDPLLEVHDLAGDARFDELRATLAPTIRFYAGAPIRLEGEEAVGTVCVMDHRPRTLTAAQRRQLIDLGRLARSLIEGRTALRAVADAGSGALQRTLVELDTAQRITGLGSWSWDLGTDVTHWSAGMYRVLGLPQAAVPPSFEDFLELLVPEDRPVLLGCHARVRAEGGSHVVTLRVRRPDGRQRTIEARTESLGGPGAMVLTGTIHDVTARVRMEAQLLARVTTDALTGLPNRTAVLEEIDAALGAAAPERQAVTVLVVAIANFQDASEAFGVEAADVMLRSLATTLRRELAPLGVVGRTGDNQFTCVMPHADAPRVVGAWDRVASLVTGRPMSVGPTAMSVELAAGVATSDGRGVGDGHDLLRRAVIACGLSAQEPTRPTTVFEESWLDATRRKVDLAEALTRAVADGTVEVAYQPLVRLHDGAIVGAEALARWRHPSFGPVPPDEFIAIAERSGLIHRLGAHVLATACAEAATWPGTGLSVNVSGHQLASDGIVAVVGDALAGSGLDPRRLTLEVTETVLMADPERIAARLWALAELGVAVAIDDFGTGYSSLAYLARFPVHTLKVDRSFVNDLDLDRRTPTIVAAILRLADALGATTLAEGIETEAQRATLAGLGCLRGQGYLFSRPVPAAEMRALLGA